MTLVLATAGCAAPWTVPSTGNDYPQPIPMDEILAAAEVPPLAPAP